MGIKRRVLHYDTLGHANAERGKIPDCLDTSRHHFVRNALRYLDRNGQYPDTDIVFLPLPFKLIGMENRDEGNVSKLK